MRKRDRGPGLLAQGCSYSPTDALELTSPGFKCC